MGKLSPADFQLTSFYRFFPAPGSSAGDCRLASLLHQLWEAAFFYEAEVGRNPYAELMPRLKGLSADEAGASPGQAEVSGSDYGFPVFAHFEGGRLDAPLRVRLGVIPRPEPGTGDWIVRGHRRVTSLFLRTPDQWEAMLDSRQESLAQTLRRLQPPPAPAQAAAGEPEADEAEAEPKGEQADRREPEAQKEDPADARRARERSTDSLRVLGLGDLLEDLLLSDLAWTVRWLRRRLDPDLLERLEGTPPTDGEPSELWHLLRGLLTDCVAGPFLKVLHRLAHPANGRNPLALRLQRREVNFHGPGGVHTRSIGYLSLRDVHPQDLFRLCPVQTPQGPGMGLRLQLARNALIDAAGHLASAGGVPADALGDAASLIPFVGHDDVARALMGANMMAQALPLGAREPPLVQTGWERELATRLSAADGFVAQSQLALGTNLLVGYLPWGLESFEDGIVVGTSAGQALTTRETQTFWFEERRGAFDNRLQRQAALVVAENNPHLGAAEAGRLDGGVVRPGEEVGPGDVLVSGLRCWSEPVKKTDVLDQLVTGLVEAIFGATPLQTRDASLRVPSWFRGTVKEVLDSRSAPDRFPALRRGVRRVGVVIERSEPLQVGDKLSNRHGNKGVVVRILPDGVMPFVRVAADHPRSCRDEECPVRRAQPDMPHRHLQVLLNPLGVIGRLNVGQLYETAAGKIAELKGEPIVVQPFETGWSPKDLAEALKRAGVEGTDGKEEVLLWDEARREVRPLRQRVLVGPQYLFRLHHLAGDKLHGRGQGEFWQYSRRDDQPLAGKRMGGGQRLGEMETWALAAHNAWDLLDDFLTFKSDDRRLRAELAEQDAGGEREEAQALPALNAGHRVVPPPARAHRRPRALVNLVLVLRALGLDLRLWNGDRDVTAQFLAARAGATFQRMTLDVATVEAQATWELRAEISSAEFYDEDGRPDAKGLLSRVICERPWQQGHIALAAPVPHPLFADMLWDLFTALPAGRTALLDADVAADARRPPAWAARLAMLLDESGQTWPEGADRERLAKLGADRRRPADFLLRTLPVLPPSFLERAHHPPGVATLLRLYQRVLLQNQVLRNVVPAKRNRPADPLGVLPHEWQQCYRRVERLFLGEAPTDESLLALLKGKKGLLRGRCAGKRADFSGRAVIVGDPSVPLDEIRLPDALARALFPGRGLGTGEQALVLLNRQPTLHRYSIQAFRSVPAGDNASVLRLNPFVCKGFNADFDGDTMAVHVPRKHAAVREARRLLPSANLFSQAAGNAVLGFGGDIALGAVYLCYGPEVGGSEDVPLIANPDPTLKARDPWEVLTTPSGVTTTVGRLRLKQLLPQERLPNRDLDARTWHDLVEAVARRARRDPAVISNFTTCLVELLGPLLRWSGLSLSIADFVSAPESGMGGGGPHFLDLARRAGVKGDPEAIRAPRGTMNRLTDGGQSGAGRTEPIASSLLGGHGPEDYLRSAHGARASLADKLLSTAPAGVLLRFLVYSLQDVFIVAEDCGCNQGLDADGDTAVGRYDLGGDPVSQPPDSPRAVRSPVFCEATSAAGSPGLCRKCYGLDPATGQPPDLGLPAGLLAAHAVGERATQLKLRTFHTGGAAGAGGGLDLGWLRQQIAAAAKVQRGEEAAWVENVARAFAGIPDAPRRVHLEVILAGMLRRAAGASALLADVAFGDLRRNLRAAALRHAGDSLTGVVSRVIAGRAFPLSIHNKPRGGDEQRAEAGHGAGSRQPPASEADLGSARGAVPDGPAGAAGSLGPAATGDDGAGGG